MGYLLSLTPTFTQGFILGQLSILVLLSLILKYLFLESRTNEEADIQSVISPIPEKEHKGRRNGKLIREESETSEQLPESAEWFSLIAHKVIETYRCKLRDDMQDSKGDEIARKRIENYFNQRRPQSFVDPISISSVDLGSSAPRISHVHLQRKSSEKSLEQIEVDLIYEDTVSVSVSSSILFHYPVPNFARLPVSLSVSLAYFSFTLLVTPPSPFSSNPVLTISLRPNFTLELNITSLIGSRAKLADVPKLNEMIRSHIRKILLQQGTWKVVLPGIANAEAVKIDEAEDSHSEKS